MNDVKNPPDDHSPPLKLARRWHDMGGDTAGPIPMKQLPNADHDFSLWEKRVDALMIIGSAKGFFTVDGLRRVLEDMGEDAFETMTYYERWVMAINQNLIEGGAYTTAELAEKMALVAARGSTYGDAAAQA
jgi:hypothetical protein